MPRHIKAVDKQRILTRLRIKDLMEHLPECSTSRVQLKVYCERLKYYKEQVAYLFNKKQFFELKRYLGMIKSIENKIEAMYNEEHSILLEL